MSTVPPGFNGHVSPSAGLPVVKHAEHGPQGSIKRRGVRYEDRLTLASAGRRAVHDEAACLTRSLRGAMPRCHCHCEQEPESHCALHAVYVLPVQCFRYRAYTSQPQMASCLRYASIHVIRLEAVHGRGYLYWTLTGHQRKRISNHLYVRCFPDAQYLLACKLWRWHDMLQKLISFLVCVDWVERRWRSICGV